VYRPVIVTHTVSILYSFLRRATTGDERAEGVRRAVRA